MNVTLAAVRAAAVETGFSEDSLEKVIQLIETLNELRDEGLFEERLVLKGGTALNLFIFEIPRLSVDIDLNYIGSLDRQEMLNDRKEVENSISRVLRRRGFTSKSKPTSHAGGKIRFGYVNSFGMRSHLSIDLSFTSRLPLWPISRLDSFNIGEYHASAIPVVDIHELAAGKLRALFSRSRARDIFDTHSILQSNLLDNEKLRLSFLVLGASSRIDWRTISHENVKLDRLDFQQNLIPLLPERIRMNLSTNQDHGTDYVNTCRELVSRLLPLRDNELEFLTGVLDRGEIRPELLTSVSELAARIERQPHLRWKILNVRKRARLSD